MTQFMVFLFMMELYGMFMRVGTEVFFVVIVHVIHGRFVSLDIIVLMAKVTLCLRTRIMLQLLVMHFTEN